MFLCCVKWSYKWLCALFFMLSVTSCSEVVAASTGHWCHYYSVMSNKDFCTFVWSCCLNTLPWSTCSTYFASINQTTDWTCFKIGVLFSHKWWNCIYTTDILFITLSGWFENKGESNTVYWTVFSKINGGIHKMKEHTFCFLILCTIQLPTNATII